METATTRYPIPTGAGDLARRTTVGVLTAVVATLLTRAIAGTLAIDLGATGAMTPFAAVPLVASAVFAGAGAAVAYAALVRLTERPVRNFVLLAGVVFVGMLLPVVLFAPALGVTTAGQALLVVLHVTVAVPLTAFVIGAVRL